MRNPLNTAVCGHRVFLLQQTNILLLFHLCAEIKLGVHSNPRNKILLEAYTMELPDTKRKYSREEKRQLLANLDIEGMSHSQLTF